MRSGKWLLLILLLWPATGHAQLWGNEPSNAIVLHDWSFSSILGPNMSNPYNAGTIATDSGAPVSPPNVYKSWISAGQSSGGTELHWNSNTTYREMYVGLMWRTNAEFFGRQVANKLFFVRGPVSNGVFMMMGGPGGGNDAGKPSYIVFAHNSGNINNGHACGGDFAGATCFPNVGSGQVVPAGTWFKIEAYIKSSTTNTSRDGIVRWWVNGQMAGNYTNLNVSSLGLNEWVWSETWDGTVNPPPSTEWAHFIDHLHISTCNGCNMSSGGGTSPPSPSPSPTPPSPTPPPPTGNPGTVSNLAVVPQSSTTALVSFSAVDDGTGSPAKYDNRLAPAPINWGATSSIASGACASPFAPAGVIGSTVTCLLTGLTPGQSYQLQNVAFRGTMNAGAIYGSLGNVASFTMPSSNVPAITNFTPASGATGVSVTITGSNFGATVGANTVKFNGQTATISSASATSLTVTAPDGVTTGKISVQTDQGIVYSEQNFTVGGESSSCGCS